MIHLSEYSEVEYCRVEYSVLADSRPGNISGDACSTGCKNCYKSDVRDPANHDAPFGIKEPVQKYNNNKNDTE